MKSSTPCSGADGDAAESWSRLDAHRQPVWADSTPRAGRQPPPAFCLAGSKTQGTAHTTSSQPLVLKISQREMRSLDQRGGFLVPPGAHGDREALTRAFPPNFFNFQFQQRYGYFKDYKSKHSPVPTAGRIQGKGQNAKKETPPQRTLHSASICWPRDGVWQVSRGQVTLPHFPSFPSRFQSSPSLPSVVRPGHK